MDSEIDIIRNAIADDGSELSNLIIYRKELLERYSTYALVTASKLGMLDNLRLLFEECDNMDPNVYDDDGMTPLVAAAEGGYHKCMEVLLRYGARTDVILALRYSDDLFGLTALVAAANSGHVKCVDLLIRAGANVNLRHDNGNPPLTAAIFGSRNECFRRLMNSLGLDFLPQGRGDASLYEPSWFASFQWLDVVLCSKGIDVNDKNDPVTTSLIASTCKSSIACVKCILNSDDVNVNAKNNEGITALMVAARGFSLECLNLILNAKGVDLNAKNNTGATAFMEAAKFGFIPCLAEIAFTKGVDVNAYNYFGATALMEAASVDKFYNLDFLLNLPDLDVNATDAHGRTALIYAVQGRALRCVSCLLRSEHVNINARFDYESQGIQECTALTLACDLWEPHIALRLIEAGVDLVKQKTNKRNALMCMSSIGHLTHIKALIQAGYSVIEVDPRGKNALYIAAESYRINCVPFLLESVSDGEIRCESMKRVFMDSSEGMGLYLALPFLLKRGVFSWDWYPSYYEPALRCLAKTLVYFGMAPGEFMFRGEKVTPLRHAFMIGDSGLIKYFLACLYFTPSDLNIQRDSRFGEYMKRHGSAKAQVLYDKLCSEPWSLEIQSFLRVSTLLRSEVKRRCDVIGDSKLQTLLPKKVKKRLAFKGRYQRLNVATWDVIPDSIFQLDLLGCDSLPDDSDDETDDDEGTMYHRLNFYGFPSNTTEGPLMDDPPVPYSASRFNAGHQGSNACSYDHSIRLYFSD